MINHIKHYLAWPWIVSVPLLVGAFICSVFFIGTDSPLFAPAVLALLAFAGIALYPNFKEGWAVPHTNTFTFMMCFWLWVVVSLLWSTTPYISTIFTIIVGLLPALCAIGVMTRRPDEWVKVHALAIWLAIGGFAVWALIQFFFMRHNPVYGPRIHHPFLDPNSLAGLLNLAVAPAIGLFVVAKGRIWTVLSGLALLILYAALVVTQSRAGFVSCAIASFILLPFAVWRNPTGLPWKKLLFIAVMAAAVPLIGNSQAGLENLVRPTVQETFMETRSLEDRFYLWQSTWNMIKDHFWFGTGLASFFFYYPRYRMPLDRSDGFFAHMDPLQYWAEMGVMAPILFYGTLICVLFRTIHAVRSAAPENIAGRMKVLASFCGMLAVTGHAHMNYHLYMPGLLLPLSILLAYWYIASEQIIGDAGKRWTWKPEGRARRIALGALVLIAILIGGWMTRIAVATNMLIEVQKVANTGNMQAASEKLRLAGLIAPGSFGRYQEYEARFRVSWLWQNARTANKDEVRKVYEEAMEYLAEAEKLNRAFTTIWDLRARANYAVNGILLSDGQELAIKELLRVIEANPLAADSRVGLANMYQARGEIKKAAEIMEQGAAWPRQKGQTDVNFLVTLANLKLQLGERDAYNRYMGEALARAKSYGMTVHQ